MNQQFLGHTPVTAESLAALHVINLERRLDRWERLAQHIHHDLRWDVPLVQHRAIDAHD